MIHAFVEAAKNIKNAVGNEINYGYTRLKTFRASSGSIRFISEKQVLSLLMGIHSWTKREVQEYFEKKIA